MPKSCNRKSGFVKSLRKLFSSSKKECDKQKNKRSLKKRYGKSRRSQQKKKLRQSSLKGGYKCSKEHNLKGGAKCSKEHNLKGGAKCGQYKLKGGSIVLPFNNDECDPQFEFCNP